MSEQKHQYICMLCAAEKRDERGDGFCPVHPDEPILDASLDEVKFQLMEADDRRRNKIYSIWLVVMILGWCILAIVLISLGIIPKFA